MLRKRKDRSLFFGASDLRVVGFNRRRVYRLFPGPWRFISFSPRKLHDNREPVDAPLFLGRELLPVPRTPDLHLLRRLRNGVAISSVIPTNYTPIPIKYEQRAASRSLRIAEGFGPLFFFLLLLLVLLRVVIRIHDECIRSIIPVFIRVFIEIRGIRCLYMYATCVTFMKKISSRN